MLRFHFKWSEHEYNQVKHMQETFRAIIAEMGGEVFSPMPTRESGYGILTGGRIIHEVGVTRMGNSTATSVLNSNCQAHDVKNLFVADGGPFVSQSDKNPTWTILAPERPTRGSAAAEGNGGNLEGETGREGGGGDASPGPRVPPRPTGRHATWNVPAVRCSPHVRQRVQLSSSSPNSLQRTSTRRFESSSISSCRATNGPAAPPTPVCRSSWTSLWPINRVGRQP